MVPPKNILWIACLVSLMWGPQITRAQEKAAGPVLEGYGPAWEVAGVTFPTEPGRPLRMVLEISSTPKDKARINPWLETAARFLNMHARSGVSTSDLHVALVVHNEASPDLLANPHYAARYGQENPNAEMLSELMAAGVEIVLCGQSSASRDVPIENTVPGVQLALSAMTALIRYQDREYRLIKF